MISTGLALPLVSRRTASAASAPSPVATAAVVIAIADGSGSLTWGTASFNPGELLLNAPTAGEQLILSTTALWLNGQDRTVRVDASPIWYLRATITGVIGNRPAWDTAPAGLIKVGIGILELTGTNTYDGPTTITDGVLHANDGIGLPTNSNLVIHGEDFIDGTPSQRWAVLQTAASFSRALGSGAGQVQVTGGVSGFRAGGAGPGPAVTVNLGGTAGTVRWGGPAFNPSVLLLNDASATQDLIFANSLDLNGMTRTVRVDSFPATAHITGTIFDSAGVGGLIKTGNGTLVLIGGQYVPGPDPGPTGHATVGRRRPQRLRGRRYQRQQRCDGRLRQSLAAGLRRHDQRRWRHRARWRAELSRSRAAIPIPAEQP